MRSKDRPGFPHPASKALAAILCATLISGCSSAVKLAPAHREKARAASVSPSVGLPDSMYYYGPTDAAVFSLAGGLAGGAIGAAAASVAGAQMGGNPGDLDPLAGQFRKELERTAREAFLVSATRAGWPLDGKSDLQLKLRIERYGFAVAPWGITRVKPVAIVWGTITDRSGNVLWKNAGGVNENDTVVRGASSTEYRRDPQMMREHLQAALRVAAGRLAETLVAAPR